VILSTDSDVVGLQTIDGVKSVDRTEYGYQLRVDRPEAARQVLRTAIEQTVVNRFEVMEPTLNEIFIKTVGGEAYE
jgi:ABC-2 type transport system ATP-binding protein